MEVFFQKLKQKLYKHLILIILSLTLLLGASLRLYQLGADPSGFFCDEASIGYNAYTIAISGVDEYGIPFPLFFRAFGEYKGPVEIYSTVPFVKILGLSEFSTRLPSALYGIFSILAIYFLVKEMFHDKKQNFIAIVSGIFLAISPWAIHFSRVALEGLMPFVFFTTSGLYFFLKAQRKPKNFYVAIVLFSFALYSYFPARIFIPLFCLGLTVIYFRFFIKEKKIVLQGALLLLILLIPFILNAFSPGGLARWQQVSIFSQPPKDESIQQHIVSNYFQHFSIDFLFLKGDINMPGQFITRHSVKGLGELYLFQLPLIIVGLIFFIKTKRKVYTVILLWLILYPIGSMFTIDNTPQATRSIIGVVPLQILSAIGLEYLLEFFIKMDAKLFAKSLLHSTFAIGTGIVILLSFNVYMVNYFFSYPLYSSDFWGWQYGAKDVISFFVQNKQIYDDEYMAPEFNAPEIFFKFYAPHDCSKCRIGTPDKTYDKHRKQLFAVTPDYEKQNPQWEVYPLKTIYYPNNTVAFIVGEIVQ